MLQMIKNAFHFITIDLFTEPIRAGMQKKSASKWNLFFLNCTHYSIAFKSLHMSWYGFVCEREFIIQRCTSLSILCLRDRWSLFSVLELASLSLTSVLEDPSIFVIFVCNNFLGQTVSWYSFLCELESSFKDALL